MRIILVRHGETAWNAEGRAQGFTDVELSEVGVWQADLLGRSLADEPIEAIYASDLSRAIATARAIAEPHSLEVETDADLRELNQGLLEGLNSQEMRAGHAELLKEWNVRPADVKMPEGESMAELQERAWRAIERVLERHSQGEGTVVVVSHNLAIHSILCKILGLDLSEFRRLKQDVSAKNIIELTSRGLRLDCMNDTSHLQRG